VHGSNAYRRNQFDNSRLPNEEPREPMNHFSNLCLTIFFALILSACASQSGPGQPLKDQAGIEKRGIQDLLIAAERTSAPESNQLRLRAIRKLIDSDDFDQANRVMASIVETELTAQQTTQYVKYRAYTSLENKQPKIALNWLSSTQNANISADDSIELSRLRASAYFQTRSFLASATELVFIDNLLDEEEKQANHEKIWNALAELPEHTLTNLAKTAVTSDMRGWLSLSAMAKKYKDNPTRQLQELTNWKQIWSYHPAAQLLPSSLALLANVVSNQPERIALLLPLHGELAAYGAAIRDGFLAAHYHNVEEAQFSPSIKILDTSTSEIATLYQQAVSEGAELIIGPLDKNKVAELKHVPNLQVPVLTLNRAIDGESHKGLLGSRVFQFGLSPEDEVLQVAQQARMEGYSSALIIVPNDEWGIRNGTTFMDEWHKLGGSIAEVTYFNDSRDYSEMVQDLLHVSDSEKRATDLRRILRERFEFTPRRRRDIDFIFLLASPTQARGINPTLAFYYAEDLPVYSTSHINSGSDSLMDYMDLNGVRFCDIPWKLNGSGDLFERIGQSWENSRGALAPFYALGVDAYHLHQRLSQMEQIPGAKVFGMTGIITLEDNRTFKRRLPWAQVKNGKVRAIPQVTDAVISQPDSREY
jgi:outer membrane PBP1 activator LpoA protein